MGLVIDTRSSSRARFEGDCAHSGSLQETLAGVDENFLGTAEQKYLIVRMDDFGVGFGPGGFSGVIGLSLTVTFFTGGFFYAWKKFRNSKFFWVGVWKWFASGHERP